MAEIGVLEGYKHKEDVPDSEYLRYYNFLKSKSLPEQKDLFSA